MTTHPLIVPAPLARQIEAEAVAAYPHESCGAMLGRDDPAPPPARRVVRLAPLPNSFQRDEQFHRFSLDGRDMIRTEKAAAQDGLTVLGFYHSHPDHPARPSEYDREHAWPFYSYLIVSLAAGRPVDMTSWLLDEATQTFSRQDIHESATHESAKGHLT